MYLGSRSVRSGLYLCGSSRRALRRLLDESKSIAGNKQDYGAMRNHALIVVNVTCDATK